MPSIGRGERGFGGRGGPEAPGGPGGPGGGGGNGRGGGFRNLLQPLPSAPPAAPFDVNTASQLCTSDAQAVAQKISGELKAYQTQIEASKTAAGYPSSMPSPQLDDATVTYHGMGSTYALTIVPKLGALPQARLASEQAAAPSPSPSARGSNAGTARGNGRGNTAMRAYIGCFSMHMAQPDDLTSRHLYAPQNGVFAAPQITFMPETGLYVMFRQAQAGQESFRVYALPSSPPSKPFQVRTAADTCTPDLRNMATQGLAQLQNYFANGVKPSLWTVSSHQAKGGNVFYELVPGDPAMVGALLMCGRVAAAAPDDLLKRGYDGYMTPEVNYAKALGLYIVRPQRPPAAAPVASPSPEP